MGEGAWKDKIAQVITQTAYHAALRPYRTIALCILFVILSMLGFLNFSFVGDADRLFVPQNSRAFRELRNAEAVFGLANRRASAVMYQDGAPAGGSNVLTVTAFRIALELRQELLTEVVNENGQGFDELGAPGLLSQDALSFFADVEDFEARVSSTADLLTVINAGVDSDGRDLEVDNFFGNCRMDEVDPTLVTECDSLLMTTFLAPFKRDDERLADTVDWERAFEEVLGRANIGDYAFVFETASSGNRELNRSVTENLHLFGLAVIMVSMLVIAFVGRGRAMEQAVIVTDPDICLAKYRTLRRIAGVSNVFCVILSCIAAFGIGLAFGLSLNSVAVAIPFVVIGIGIDDMFVMLSAYDIVFMLELSHVCNPLIGASTSREAVARRMHLGMRRISKAILLTTITNVLAFLLMTISPIPVFFSFGMFAALAVFIDFGMQITLFVALFAISEHPLQRLRQERWAPGSLSELPTLDDANGDSFWRDFDKRGYRLILPDVLPDGGAWLTKKYVPWIRGKKTGTILAVFIVAVIGLHSYLTSTVEPDNSVEEGLPDDSFLLDYGERVNQYGLGFLSEGISGGLFYYIGVDIRLNDVQELLYSVERELRGDGHVNDTPFVSLLKTLLNEYAPTAVPACVEPSTGDASMNVWRSEDTVLCGPLVFHTHARTLVTLQPSFDALAVFTGGPVGETGRPPLEDSLSPEFLVALRAQFGLGSDDDMLVAVSTSYVQLERSGVDDAVPGLLDVFDVVDEHREAIGDVDGAIVDISATEEDGYLEQRNLEERQATASVVGQLLRRDVITSIFLVLERFVVIALLSSLAAVIVVLVLDFGKSYLLITTITVGFTGAAVLLYGSVRWWGLNLSLVVTINIVMSVGLVIDALLHVPHATLQARGLDRGLGSVGMATVHSILTTAVAPLVLLGATSQVLRIFGRMLLNIGLTSAFFGLVMVPLVLAHFFRHRDTEVINMSAAAAPSLLNVISVARLRAASLTGVEMDERQKRASVADNKKGGEPTFAKRGLHLSALQLPSPKEPTTPRGTVRSFSLAPASPGTSTA